MRHDTLYHLVSQLASGSSVIRYAPKAQKPAETKNQFNSSFKNDNLLPVYFVHLLDRVVGNVWGQKSNSINTTSTITN